MNPVEASPSQAVATCQDALPGVLIGTRPGNLRVEVGTRGIRRVAPCDARATIVPLPPDDPRHDWILSLATWIETGSGELRAPLEFEGTPFQRRVWEILRAIPFGETRTYAAVARSLGMPGAARAVARACAANELAIAIPCHRVVPASGGPGGYRWGRAFKQNLLQLEQVLTSSDR